MPGHQAPSPVLRYLVRELGRSLPESEGAKLARYAEAVGATTRRGDLGRAFRCAEWAVRVAEGRSDSRLGRLAEELKEARVLWRDSLFGAHYGAAVVDGVGPGEDVEIQWVDAAVTVARDEARRSGWGAVPWEDLLKTAFADADPG
ncbi:MAG: hypothetical protein ABSF84_01840 [Acidimicrobiales bacterium]|jgi:hypothetical protein